MLRNYSYAAYVSTETMVIPGAMGAGQVVILVTYTTTAIAVQENDVVVTLLVQTRVMRNVFYAHFCQSFTLFPSWYAQVCLFNATFGDTTYYVSRCV